MWAVTGWNVTNQRSPVVWLVEQTPCGGALGHGSTLVSETLTEGVALSNNVLLFLQ